MAAENILGLAVRGVLENYDNGGLNLTTAHRAVYEGHYERVSQQGAIGVDAELAREHLSPMMQGEALDAIIAHVQRDSPGSGAQQLAKEQFLTICHLVSAALEAAQTSDALWVEPQLPASAAHKRRHPTLREIVGSRMAEAAEQQVEEAEARTPSPDKPRQPGADSRDRSSKENEAANVQPAQAQAGGPLGEGAAAMAQQPAHSAPAGGSRQASPGKPAGQPAVGVLGVRNAASEATAGAAGAGASGVADITDFERKLQELMQKMQRDQAKLQGRLSGSASKEEQPAAHATAEEGVQTEQEQSATVSPSMDAAWESFNNSPEAVPSRAAGASSAFAAFPGTDSPLAAGAASAAFEDFATSFFLQQQQQAGDAASMPSPFAELNPVRHAGPPVAVGLPVSAAPAPGSFALPAGGLSAQEAAALHTTPLAAGLAGRTGLAAYASPQVQRVQHFAGAAAAAPAAAPPVDPTALAAAVQQLSLQQALAAQLAASEGSVPGHSPSLAGLLADPAAAAAIARAQAQLEAAAASLVAAATARPSTLSQERGLGGGALRGGASEAAHPSAAARPAQPFTARDHHVHASAPRLGRPTPSPAAASSLGPLGAAVQQPQPGQHRQPSRLSRQSSPTVSQPASQADSGGGAPMTARAAAQADTVELSSWQPMAAEDLQRCEGIFSSKGYEALGGMAKLDAQQLFAKLQMAPHLFAQVWAAADVNADGVLSKQEFCLFMYLLRKVQHGYPVPLRLTPGQAATLLGLVPPPQQDAVGMMATDPAASEHHQQPLKVDLARIKSALRPGSRQQLLEAPGLPLQGEQDAGSDSDDDSGFDCMSVSSKCSMGPGALHHLRGPSHLFRHSLQSAYSQRYEGGDGVCHARLGINIRGAEIRYSKPLDRPFFNISVHDSLLRVVELPQDTPPGHYRKETHSITLNHAVELQTQLAQMPRGSVCYIELKHFKSREGRMSTLAWSFVPLEKVVDFGPVANRVREGPLNLPLFRKPLDLSLRRLKRLGKHDDLRLSIFGAA